jgi:hypothetical protein
MLSMAWHGFNAAYYDPVDNKLTNQRSIAIDQNGTAAQTEQTASPVREVPPPKPPRNKANVVAPQPPVPSEEFVRRISDVARRAFPAAPAVSSTAPEPKNEHVDLLALELWASGNLPDPGIFGRWKSHLATCEKCTARLNAANARRQAG